LTERERFRLDLLDNFPYGATEHRVLDPKGNLVSSRLPEEFVDVDLLGLRFQRKKRRRHMPVIDLDGPHKLVRSSTKGHGHLYIDQPITWRKYKRILKALKKAGVIEYGWYKTAMNYRMSFVRAPGVTKKITPMPAVYGSLYGD
jgi:hypothetical protein